MVQNGTGMVDMVQNGTGMVDMVQNGTGMVHTEDQRLAQISGPWFN